MSLANRHVVVTGGGSGVGAAAALILAEAGGAVTILGRRADALAAVADQHDAITGHVADVTNRAALASALDDARLASGPIDVMVASAGISTSKPFHRLAADDVTELMSVNLMGVFNSFQIAYDDVRKRGWGRLIAVASTADRKSVV